jgi:hypothetical protein
VKKKSARYNLPEWAVLKGMAANVKLRQHFLFDLVRELLQGSEDVGALAK